MSSRGFNARLKGLLPVLLIMLVLGAWFYFSIRADYGWSATVISEKQQEGWVVASATSNLADLTRPWTIFRPSARRIAFVRPTEIVWTAENRPSYRVVWVDRDLGEDIFINIANCRTGESAFVEGERLPDQPHSELEWRLNEPGTPGAEIVQTDCEEDGV